MLSNPTFWVAASFVIFVLLAGRKAWWPARLPLEQVAPVEQTEQQLEAVR